MRSASLTSRTPWLLFAAICLVGGIGFYRYSRPIPPAETTHALRVQDESNTPVALDWPLAPASVGTVEHGVLASSSSQPVRPTASTAKLITVLTVLKEKPLALGEPGPILTMDHTDVALYNRYLAANGSLVAISPGEQLSQYQMIQGILIRSGNNLADSLAIWAFGSLAEYQKAAQKLVDELGMTNTTVGTDASGLSPTTTSTAEDLTRLGIAAMKHDVVREIVRQPTSNLPVDGQKPNTNWMLGQNGVVGVKTGNIPEVGGVFVIASEYAPEGEKPMTIVGAVHGAVSTYAAITQADQLADAARSLFVHTTVIKKGAVVATVTTPWGEHSNIVTKDDVITFGWKYAQHAPSINITGTAPFQKDAVLGSVSIGDYSSDLIAAQSINPPSWQWRLSTSR